MMARFFGPRTGLWRSLFGYPVVGDIDGDGFLEIFVDVGNPASSLRFAMTAHLCPASGPSSCRPPDWESRG